MKFSNTEQIVLDYVISHSPTTRAELISSIPLPQKKIAYVVRRFTERKILLTIPNLLDMRRKSYYINPIIPIKT